MKRIDRSVMECSGARKNFVGVGWGRLAVGRRYKRLERCSRHNRGQFKPRAVVAVELDADGFAGLMS